MGTLCKTGNYVSCYVILLTNFPPKTLARSILGTAILSRVVGVAFFCLLLSELKNAKERGTSKNKHTESDEEDEGGDEERSDDETDSEVEDMAEKEQSSSEEGTYM